MGIMKYGTTRMRSYGIVIIAMLSPVSSLIRIKTLDVHADQEGDIPAAYLATYLPKSFNPAQH